MSWLWRLLPARFRPLAARALELALRLSSRQAGVALVYHAITERPPTSADALAGAHEASLVEAQVRYVSRRYRLVRAEELLDAVRARRRFQRYPVALTFDDDLPTHVRTAAPALGRLGAPATFFLCGASLERPFAFWWERLQRAVESGRDLAALGGVEAVAPTVLALRIEEETPRRRDEISEQLAALVGEDPPHSGMRAADVHRLVEKGFEIGFHTRRHDRLPPLDDAELEKALREGRVELERVAGRRLTMVAYPHGRADARVADAARAAGFRLGFTGSGEAVTASSDPLLLGRIEPAFTDVASFAGQLAWALRRAHR